MAEKKIVSVEAKEETKKSGLNIDLSDLKKIGSAILAFIASNPELVGKLIDKPASMLKKIINKEDVSSDTKKKVKKTISNNKSEGLSGILTSLSSGINDGEISDLFGKITSTIKTGEIVNGVGNLLKGDSKKSSSGLGSILKGLFK